jgi:hypothetical protein
MRRLILLSTIALSACGSQYQAQMACRQQAGNEPHAGYLALGVLGAAMQAQTVEWQDWHRYVQACVRTKEMEASR